MKKIVITGVHATPGLAVAEILKQRDWKIYWFGEKKAILGKNITTLEYKVIPELGIPFYGINTAKLTHRFPKIGILFFWKELVGFLQSFWLLLTIRPNVVLSFGSYVSIPVVFSAWILRIPIIIHEQTVTAGRANKINSHFATKIAVSAKENVNFFPREKTVVTGNPIRESILVAAEKRRGKKLGTPPILYVTGGSRGSQIVNNAVFSTLSVILDRFKVYHQTGDLDYEQAKRVKNRLPLKEKKRYFIAPVYKDHDLVKVLEKADIVISRAGANTVSELAVLGIPTIFIPIPWSEANEQTKNAQVLVRAGTSVLLPQNSLDKKTLLGKIEELMGKINRYKSRAPFAARTVKKDAGKLLADLAEGYCQKA